MAEIKKLVVPDLGSDETFSVAEVFVKIGDHIQNETPLFALESDKAVMEIPSPVEGILTSFSVSSTLR